MQVQDPARMVGISRSVVVIVLVVSFVNLTLQCTCDGRNYTRVSNTSSLDQRKQPESQGRSFGFLPSKKINLLSSKDGADNDQNDEEARKQSESRGPFSGFKLGGGGGGGGGDSFAGIFSDLMPAPLKGFLTISTTTTTTTTTTTPTPIQEFNQNTYEIGMGLTSALNAPIKVINGLTQVSSSGVNRAADRLVKSTSSMVQNVDSQQASVMNGGAMASITNQMNSNGPKDDSIYYEYGPAIEPFAERRPKYFSRECQFRFACEVGRVMKPFTRPVADAATQNRFLLDLQNRYTRAITYGNLYDSCERYYCVLVQLMGGPVGFAGGVSEIVNRMVNKDQYDDVTVV